jgi:hypothetical protein
MWRRVVSKTLTDISEECTASIFRFEKLAVQAVIQIHTITTHDTTLTQHLIHHQSAKRKQPETIPPPGTQN